jgi:hypothetical protein
MDKKYFFIFLFVYSCYINLVKSISLLGQQSKVTLIIQDRIINDDSTKYLNTNYFGYYSDIDCTIIKLKEGFKEIYRVVNLINEDTKIKFVLIISHSLLIDTFKVLKINKPVFYVDFQALNKHNQVNK